MGTGSGIWPVYATTWTTCNGWASTPCGFRPPCPRPTPTGATTSRTTTACTLTWARWPTWTAWSSRRRHGTSGSCWTSSPTTPPAPTPGSWTPVPAKGSAHRDYYVWADPKADGGPPNNWICATGAAGLDLRRRKWPVLPAQFPARPAGPQLVGRTRPRGVRRDPGVTGSTAGWPASVSTWPTGCTKTPCCGTTRRRGRPTIPLYSGANCARSTTRTAPRSTRSTGGGARLPTVTSRSRPCSARRGNLTTSASGTITAGTSPSCTWVSISVLWRSAFTAPALADVVESTLAALPPGATPVWTASNHDVGRFPTRWCGDDARAVKAALTVLSTPARDRGALLRRRARHGRRGRARRPCGSTR